LVLVRAAEEAELRSFLPAARTSTNNTVL